MILYAQFKFARRAVTIAALSTLATACRAERTQIVVAVDTDFAVPSALSALRVTVSEPGAIERVVQPIVLKGLSTEGCTDVAGGPTYCAPLSFLLVPREGRTRGAAVEVTVEGIGSGDPLAARSIVSRTARLNFAAGQTLRLPMFLSRACIGVICPTDFTCAEQARCVRVDEPPGLIVVDPRTGSPRDAAEMDADASDPIARDAMIDSDASDASDAIDSSRDGRADGAVNVESPCARRACPRLDALAAGRDFTCALYTSGGVACWGANDVGQLGRGTSAARETDGSGGSSSVEFVASLTGVRQLAAGDAHVCASWMMPPDRGVSCWGRNTRGALAVGSLAPFVASPTMVTGLGARAQPSLLALGEDATFALVGASVFVWGDNADGAIGFGSASAFTTATAVMTGARWSAISARGRGLCWLDGSNTLCVGRNDGQRFGAVAAEAAVVARPAALSPSLRGDSITVGRAFSCAISEGSVSCWGANRASGVLGHVPSMGEPAIVTEPQRVSLPAAIREVVAGDDFVLALASDGRVFCWGSNADGACATGAQQPDGTVIPSSVLPREIAFPRGVALPVRAIVAGDGHACALARDDLPWCWGRNANAQTAVALSADARSRSVVAPSPVLVPAAR